MRLVQEKFSDGRWHVTGHSAAFEGHESYPVTVLYLPGVSEDLATGVDD
jgi:hypothetical protein